MLKQWRKYVRMAGAGLIILGLFSSNQDFMGNENPGFVFVVVFGTCFFMPFLILAACRLDTFVLSTESRLEKPRIDGPFFSRRAPLNTWWDIGWSNLLASTGQFVLVSVGITEEFTFWMFLGAGLGASSAVRGAMHLFRPMFMEPD